MRMIVLLAATAALVGCQKAETPAANDMAMNTDSNMMADSNAAMSPAAFQLNETTWEYTDPKTKKAITESIDGSGNYVSVSGAEHVDHGTMVMKDGKACFTSAMNKDGEMCWTTVDTPVGSTMESVSDKGEKLAVKRVDYVAMSFPPAT